MKATSILDDNYLGESLYMDQELLVELYKQMLRIRRFEEEAARLYTERKIGGFLHLYIGQEALAVGALSVLDDKDQIITSYRCHAHYLIRGGSMEAGFAELMGKSTGCSKGRGGSMHFYNAKEAFYGGWGIVGGQIPVCAGMAFANKYKKNNNLSVAFFGDGAINIGAFHEALSISSIWKLPAIYIIENNQFAMGTPIEKTASSEDLSIRALGYPMARDTMDAHDIFNVRAVMHKAAKRAREDNLPTLIEAKTYRYRGHSMADPAKYRTKDDVQKWKDRDPILVLGKKLDELDCAKDKEHVDQQIEEEIKIALEKAEAAPFPDVATATDYTFKE